MISSQTTNGLSPYGKFKDTGIAWLRNIPDHWTVQAIGRVASVQLSNVDKLSDDEELPVKLCNYVDVYKNDFITRRLPFMAATASQTEMSRFALEVGDVLITKDSETWNDIAVPALVTEEVPGVLCGYHLAQIRPLPNVLTGPYLFRALQALPIAEQFHVLASGVTRFGLSKRSIKSGTIPIPPLEEQQAIARFLDRQDRRINRFIRAKRRLIEMLNEQKQAIIHQAVTRGLDPSVPLKRSGIDWLGDIPAHWDVRRAGTLFSKREEAADVNLPILEVSLRSGVSIRDFENQSRKQMMSDLEKYQTARRGDIAYNMMRAWQGALGIAPIDGLVSPAYVVAAPEGDLSSEFYSYLLKITPMKGEIESRSRGIVPDRNRLYWDQFKQIPCLTPPPREQSEILAHIRRAVENTEKLIARATREIRLIREYRTRLRADVVTGKLDVRSHPDALLLSPVEDDFQAQLDYEDPKDDFEIETLEESVQLDGEEP